MKNTDVWMCNIKVTWRYRGLNVVDKIALSFIRHDIEENRGSFYTRMRY